MSSAASRLRTAYGMKKSNHTGPDSWQRLTNEKFEEAVSADLMRVLHEHEELRAALCVIMNRCRDRAGWNDWMLTRDRIAVHIQLRLAGILYDEEDDQEKPAPIEGVDYGTRLGRVQAAWWIQDHDGDSIIVATAERAAYTDALAGNDMDREAQNHLLCFVGRLAAAEPTT